MLPCFVGNSPTGRETSHRLALEPFSFMLPVGNSPTGRGTSCRLALESFAADWHKNHFHLCYLLRRGNGCSLTLESFIFIDTSSI